MRILIVTDAWTPQVNGVVQTLQSVSTELKAMGHQIRFATPQDYWTLPLPTYPEIRVALFPRAQLSKLLDEFRPEVIHIATEGTLGLTARALCMERGLRFTTSFHTKFPEYIHARLPFVPEDTVYDALRSFHAPAHATMVSTPSMMRTLEAHGFENLRMWTRGVDTKLFRPDAADGVETLDIPGPIFLSVGRVAIEKNLESFLKMDLPGSKVIVGDGPARTGLEAKYPDAFFLGMKRGEELARIYASADAFVFPSLTDTFGLVMLEAFASGLPVAAYPVPGPRDLITPDVGVLSHDLRAACIKATGLSRAACRDFAVSRGWRASALQFLDNLAVLRAEAA